MPASRPCSCSPPCTSCAARRRSRSAGALLPLLVSIGVGGALVYGTLGLPAFSDPAAPIHTHVAPRYLNDAVRETGVPNVVTAVLASYRGFDTLGETTVVFTAGAGVVVLLRRRRPPKTGDRR